MAANGKLTELWAKALVIEDAQGKRGLLLTLDLVGIDRTLSLSICDRISNQFGFQRDEISICLSHTHTGPVVGRNLAPMHYQLVTDAQRQLLEKFVTNTSSHVFVLRNLPEVIKGALFSRYSRSPATVRRWTCS